ncbi:HTH-type transcriptional regulator PgrR [Ephemeroptericola cinctiostellae]|uniref:HTH-type transcriptional regulator PgrR n=1 Tax=Ephemeroptericola cinctiostellae TaxID=2268024 RepID=A0A345D957_9BURK|nr:LysR family transcriptional regulator [Ephemeroptericola cinctiostellae]AXF84895.1 HTH-type transcriptional regulator PgrR [Ephemeroptericola cinctiostellae]
MSRENFNDLAAFATVARHGSFTRAAAQIGVSPSALSHTMRALEGRLGVRLLARSTRSVSLTEAGERLFLTIAPRFEEIETELMGLRESQGKPAGTVRINASEHVAHAIIWPKLAKLLPDYPDIKIEMTIEHKLVDIVAERYDIGVRLGDQVPKDMIAVKISAGLRMIVVGSPSYFANHPPPQNPSNLSQHTCINLRLPTYGGLYAWEFEKNGRKTQIHVQGQLIFNAMPTILNAALSGFGLAYVAQEMAQPYLEQGLLISALDDWCPTFAGYHLYYPSRRQSSPAFNLVIEALRLGEAN